MKNNQVVRLYDKNGRHILSILPCGSVDGGINFNCDLANPDGKVYFCDDNLDGALQAIVNLWPNIEILK